jgi:hypothetical protein
MCFLWGTKCIFNYFSYLLHSSKVSRVLTSQERTEFKRNNRRIMYILSSTSICVKDHSNWSRVLRRPFTHDIKCYIIHEILAAAGILFPVGSILTSSDNMRFQVWDITPCTLVDLHRTTQGYIVQDGNLHSHFCENIKSTTVLNIIPEFLWWEASMCVLCIPISPSGNHLSAHEVGTKTSNYEKSVETERHIN